MFILKLFVDTLFLGIYLFIYFVMVKLFFWLQCFLNQPPLPYQYQ